MEFTLVSLYSTEIAITLNFWIETHSGELRSAQAPIMDSLYRQCVTIKTCLTKPVLDENYAERFWSKNVLVMFVIA